MTEKFMSESGASVITGDNDPWTQQEQGPLTSVEDRAEKTKEMLLLSSSGRRRGSLCGCGWSNRHSGAVTWGGLAWVYMILPLYLHMEFLIIILMGQIQL